MTGGSVDGNGGLRQRWREAAAGVAGGSVGGERGQQPGCTRCRPLLAAGAPRRRTTRMSKRIWNTTHPSK